MKSKFHRYCSCINCKKELTVQSFKRHYQKCTVPQSLCKECNSPIFEPVKTFCDQSCAAKYNNRHIKRRTGPPKGFRKGHNKLCYVSWCTICDTIIKHKVRKTCSDNCKRKLLSNSSKNLCYKLKHNRGRHKKSYLEKSFEKWLYKNNVYDFVMEKSFRRKDTIKTYFVDFYFPKQNLAVELDGSQHEQTKEYDLERDRYLTSEYGINVLRITHKEYRDKSKIKLVWRKIGAGHGI